MHNTFILPKAPFFGAKRLSLTLPYLQTSVRASSGRTDMLAPANASGSLPDTMLGLLQPTPISWVAAAEAALPQLLADHAHCELKAAQSALSLVARFGEDAPELIEPLTALAKEETEHFRLVGEQMREHDVPMSRPAVDDYVRSLRAAARVDGADDPLMDRLLVCALIEARSCERFKLLAEHLSDESLRGFYRALMASEARHYRLFRGLAEARFGEAAVRKRFSELADREASVVDRLPLGPTVHG